MRLRHEIDENIQTLTRDTHYTAGDNTLLKVYCDKTRLSDAYGKLKLE